MLTKVQECKIYVNLDLGSTLKSKQGSRKSVIRQISIIF